MEQICMKTHIVTWLNWTGLFIACNCTTISTCIYMKPVNGKTFILLIENFKE